MKTSTENAKGMEVTLNQFKGKRILLIGDLVADHYIYGRTSRISREAPVLILKHQDEFVLPGQAANTANNIAALGGKVIVVGVIGRDPMGKALKQAMRKRGIPVDSLIELSGFSTLTKTRILAGGHHTCRQQVIRIDHDDRPPLDGAVHEQIMRRIKGLANRVDAVVVSDYGYNLVNGEIWSAVLRLKKDSGVPVVLDSRYQLLRLKGATLITPNEGEALESCGLSTEQDYQIEDVGRKLLRATKSDAVLVTRGNEGMAVFERGRKPRHLPIFGTDEVTDVTGAGDTVVASVSLALAAGASVELAAQMANIAGGIVVMKMGTATVTSEELAASIRSGQPPVRSI